MSIGGKIETKLAEFAACATTDGELWRPSFSKEDETSCALLEKWLAEENMEVYRDCVGNLFGRIKGRESRVILSGSHRDSVKNGGRYDGAAGIITAMLAAGELYRELGKPQKTVEIVALPEEEGSRFASSYIGSKSITGQLGENELNDADQQGIRLEELLCGVDVRQAVRDDIDLFIELHVEQGPYLEKTGVTIGVVEKIVGMIVARVTVTGQQNHAGTTPMNLRLDPMRGAAEMMCSLYAAVSGGSTLTFGEISAVPGLSNVIPEKVCFSVDCRDADEENLSALKNLLQETVQPFHEKGYQTEIEFLCVEPPKEMAKSAVDLIAECAGQLEIPYTRMNSGAGHDAQIMASKFPSGMIFIPSHAGISHSPKEYTKQEDLAAGYAVFKQALKQAAWSAT